MVKDCGIDDRSAMWTYLTFAGKVMREVKDCGIDDRSAMWTYLTFAGKVMRE